MGTLGPSKAWKRYAALCIEEELDGPTIMAMSVDDLINDYEFTKSHARVVVTYFRPQQSTNSTSPASADEIPEVKQVVPTQDSADNHGDSGGAADHTVLYLMLGVVVVSTVAGWYFTSRGRCRS